MAAQKLVAIKEFCVHHHIETGFIHDLHRNEMIELVMIKRTGYIPSRQLNSLEKMVRLYQELNINIEGIQTIFHLLSRIEKKEAELLQLKNKLDFFRSASR